MGYGFDEPWRARREEKNETLSRNSISADCRGGGLYRRRHRRFADRRQSNSDLPISDWQRLLMAGRNRLHAFLCDAADLHGARGNGGLSLRTVEYRCGRTALHRSICCRVDWHQVRRLVGMDFVAGLLSGRDYRWGNLGRDPWITEGALWIA